MWCTVPKGQIHPQNQRPNSKVTASVASESSMPAASACDASQSVSITSGSSWKKSFTPPPTRLMG